MLERLDSFKEAYLRARALSYNDSPYQYTHMFVLLVCIFCFTCPFAMAAAFGTIVWIPSVTITIAFFGMYEISKDMEKPFGFDHGDIKVESMVRLLDEKNTTTIRLALSGQFMNRPASTASDILSGLLRKNSIPEAPSRVVPQYSLCRLPSIMSKDSHPVSRPTSHSQNATTPGSGPASGSAQNFVFNLNEKTRSSVTSDAEGLSRVSSNTD